MVGGQQASQAQGAGPARWSSASASRSRCKFSRWRSSSTSRRARSKPGGGNGRAGCSHGRPSQAVGVPIAAGHRRQTDSVPPGELPNTRARGAAGASWATVAGTGRGRGGTNVVINAATDFVRAFRADIVHQQ